MLSFLQKVGGNAAAILSYTEKNVAGPKDNVGNITTSGGELLPNKRDSESVVASSFFSPDASPNPVVVPRLFIVQGFNHST